MRDDLDDASQGVPFLCRAIDFFDHFFFELRIGAIEWRVLRDRDYLFPGNFRSFVRHLHRAHADDVTSDLTFEMFQKLLCHRTGGDPGRGFASTGSFQNVSKVVDSVLQCSREVRVAGTWVHELRAGARRRLLIRRQLVLPVLPVFIVDEKTNGAARRLTTAKTTEDFHSVLLDLHSGSSAVSSLAACQFAIDSVEVQLHTGWQAFQDHVQGRAMRFARGHQAQHFVKLHWLET